MVASYYTKSFGSIIFCRVGLWCVCVGPVCLDLCVVGLFGQWSKHHGHNTISVVFKIILSEFLPVNNGQTVVGFVYKPVQKKMSQQKLSQNK